MEVYQAACTLVQQFNKMKAMKAEGKCPMCGKEVKTSEFKNDISLKEFKQSGLCQVCQNKFFEE